MHFAAFIVRRVPVDPFVRRTLARRPDLLDTAEIDQAEARLIDTWSNDST